MVGNTWAKFLGCMAIGAFAADNLQNASSVRGEIVYNKACAACHGDKGDGQGQAARYLNPRPRDFTSGMFKFRSTPSGELPNDSDLLRSVDNGIPGSQMPPWKTVLTAQERVDVVAYLKTFSADFKSAAPASVAIPAPPPATEALIHEGKFVYMLMECWACHGGQGTGKGKSAGTLKDDAGFHIQPMDLTREHYKAGNDPQTLYRTFTTGLNGTPMPAYDATGFLIGGETKIDPAKYQEAYAAAAVDELKSWLRNQPSDNEIQRMNDEQRKRLVEQRKWALVHYIGSLVKKPGFFVRMFTENTEVTR